MNLDSPQQTYQTKEEYVYSVLRRAIIQCEVHPGEKLVMDRLSQELGTSPIPIRSALQRLQAEGLVEITPHAGAVVSAISLDEISEIFSLLETLERTAFVQAAQHASPADLQELERLIAVMEHAAQVGDTRHWSETNIRFHLTVAAISGMPLLVEFTSRTLDKWIRLSRCYFSQFGSLRIHQAQEEHRQILANLQSGDLQGLETLAHQHNHQAHLAYQDLIHKEQIGDDQP